MIWNVVFANKSRKLGWIWMKLGRWGWGLKRLCLARFQRNRAMGFGEREKKWVAEALFFCHVSHAPLLPLSFDRFPPNFPRTRAQVVARDTWFHIPDKFPLRDRISRKTLFRVPYLCSGYGSRETFYDAYTLSIPSGHPTDACTFPRWLLLRDVPFSNYPPPKVILCHSVSNGDTWMMDAYNFFKHHSPDGVTGSDRRFAVVY